MNGNYVLLSGYLNYDLLNERELPFNLPLYEVKYMLELGELSLFVVISNKKVTVKEGKRRGRLLLRRRKRKLKEMHLMLMERNNMNKSRKKRKGKRKRKIRMCRGLNQKNMRGRVMMGFL